MASASSTTIHKTLRQETITLFCKFSADVTANPTIIRDNGASKGIEKVERIPAVAGDPSIYVITIDPSIRVEAQLGSPQIEQFRAVLGPAGNIIEPRLISRSNAGRVFTNNELAFAFYLLTTGTSTGIQNSICSVTIPITTLKTF